MAWCENPGCLKDGLRKADVEFCETSRKVLCHGCFAMMHPGWEPPNEYVDLTDTVPNTRAINQPRLGFAFQFSEVDGLKAQVSYGSASIAFMAPANEIKRLFGG